MKNSVIITISSHPKYLSIVRCVTVGIGELSGLQPAEIEGIKLAVDEACSNVIKHAYRGDIGKKIVVKYKVTKKSFEVTIEDNGIKSDVESMKGRDLDDLKPGGLGIHFIRKIFDVFELDSRKKDGNRLRLIKYLKGNYEA